MKLIAECKFASFVDVPSGKVVLVATYCVHCSCHLSSFHLPLLVCIGTLTLECHVLVGINNLALESRLRFATLNYGNDPSS